MKSMNKNEGYCQKLNILQGIAAAATLLVLGILLIGEPAQNYRLQPHRVPPLRSYMNSSKPVDNVDSTEDQKLILVYTTLFGDSRWSGYDENPDHLKSLSCAVANCRVTYDRSKLSLAAAVVFHARDMPPADHLREITDTIRPPWQRWAYYIAESPINTPNPASLDGLFNLTMTYRVDSDVFCPYRKFRKLEKNEPRPDPSVNYAQGKTKMAAWIASHCVGFRDRAVEMLEKHGIIVNAAGRCSLKFPNKLQCENRDCHEELRRHKFYLSFENSFCQDYVTEKFWYNAFEHDLVPVVLGGADYSNPSVVMPNSFINVQNFHSYKELADHLHSVANNDTLYNSYFSWKQTYALQDLNELYGGWPHAKSVLCGLCRIVHDKHYPHKVYDKLSEFWGVQTTCNKRGSDWEFLTRT